jgi:hypothetical protein
MKSKVIFLVIFSLNAFGLIILQSRSTIISILLIFFIIIFAFYRSNYIPNGKMWGGLIMILNSFIAVVFVPVLYFLIMARLDSVLLRLQQVRVATNLIYKSPLIGSTRDTILAETGGYIIHNGFLATGSLYGIFALLLILLIWVLSLKSATSSIINNGEDILYVLPFVPLIGLTVEVSLYFGMFSKVSWFILAIALSDFRSEGESQMYSEKNS